MGILGKVFGNKSQSGEKEKQLPWVKLERREQLGELAARSKERPQLIFKHSVTCGISSMVLKMFTTSFDPQRDCDLYFLTIQAHRELSRDVAEHFGVRHESPQLLIVVQGVATFHASHGAIADVDLQRYL